MPVMTTGRRTLPRSHDAERAGQRAGADRAVERRRSDPAHPARAVRRPRLVAPGHRPGDRRLRRRAVDRPAGDHAARHAGAGARCPAMHTEMWEHPAVAENIATLRRRGVHIVEPAVGRLAGGDSGAGRLADPVEIVAAAERAPRPAGTISPACDSSSPPAARASRSTPCGSSPTAARASRATPSPPRPRRAAPTSCSSAPSTCRHRPASRRARVETAAEMQAAVEARAPPPTSSSWPPPSPTSGQGRPPTGKLKKHDGVPEIVLEPTPDILAGLGAAKRPGQVLVGFAAETDDLLANAQAKLERQAPRPDRRQRRQRTRRRLRPRHQRRYAAARRTPTRSTIDLRDKRAIARAVVDAIVDMTPPVARSTT